MKKEEVKTNSMNRKENDLRVCWNSNGKDYYFYVKSIEDAMLVISTLSNREMQDANIIYNTYSLEVYCDGDFEDWHDDDGRKIVSYLCDDVTHNKIRGIVRYN